MTRFLSGPAAGRTLALRRAPRFLRVVECAGNFDALDQLDDQPELTETIHVYEIKGEPGRMHIYSRGPTPSGWYAVADYEFLPDQPADAEVRTTEAWRAWTLARGLKKRV